MLGKKLGGHKEIQKEVEIECNFTPIEDCPFFIHKFRKKIVHNQM